MIRQNQLATAILLLTFAGLPTVVEAETPQYESGDIKIVAARADEPMRESFSLTAAKEYLAQSSQAWTEKRNCVSCHTNGTFMQLAPTLGPMFKEQVEQHRKFFVLESSKFKRAPASAIRSGLKPTQLAYVANGLAAYDEVQGKLSAETKEALDLMLTVQSEDGSYSNLDCWPPFESSSYHGATVAAMALVTAPGYLSQVSEAQQKQIDVLQNYLQKTKPPHDYGRLLLLQVGIKWKGLISDELQQETIAMILKHQQKDGGWAMRTFATPETWGGGSRKDKLNAEPNKDAPASDGHQTGLAIMLLRESGTPADHPAIQAGIKWIKSNQRESGRWWTRSLNTDGPHFITYSGTFYPLRALQLCGELDQKQETLSKESE
ncbi:MAG: hypothetical protein CMM03_17425 [Rhodopirellula sp.]|nr:hypothetical protein [Rhodopirellula sp.]|tara:strand:- start:789 stop:1919 length:1131 start_codon:yes stop_codon:yes gene_type:complete